MRRSDRGSPMHDIIVSPKCVASSYGFATLEDTTDVPRTARSATSCTASTPPGTIRNAARRVIVMRHGERLDDLFPGWIEKSCLSGVYRAYDLNMPLVLPQLDRPMAHFDADTVLTEMGTVLAQMVGRGLLINKTLPDVVYTSPALRCVQTASFALKAAGYDDQVKIRVEPALFENTTLYPEGQPKFATPAQLAAADFNVDANYKPIMTADKLWSRPESIEEYGDRLQKTLLQLAENIETTTNPYGPIIMIVGHASTVDLAIGAFREQIRRSSAADLLNIGIFYPFCATAVFDRSITQQWKYCENALPPITYRNFTSKINSRFAFRTSVK
uniref:Phosphoglycerate mutase family protein n=1 Tax=Ascaris lumbricoides TaxID=6252 RepID=A0A0M3HSV3_ASCLU